MLRNIVERSGLVKYVDFEEQEKETSLIEVDFTVAKRRIVPVDAKTPIDKFKEF